MQQNLNLKQHTFLGEKGTHYVAGFTCVKAPTLFLKVRLAQVRITHSILFMLFGKLLFIMNMKNMNIY